MLNKDLIRFMQSLSRVQKKASAGRVEMMRLCTVNKFNQDASLTSFVLSTGISLIISGNMYKDGLKISHLTIFAFSPTNKLLFVENVYALE